MAAANPIEDDESDSLEEDDDVVVKSHTGQRQKDQMLKQIMAQVQEKVKNDQDEVKRYKKER